MTAANFDKCLSLVLVHEGGNDDDPRDHGGRTSRGVIQREYDAWRERHGEATADVWMASDQEIHDIYRAQYWQPWCDDLPDGLDYVFFDMAVNAGPVTATKLLQRCLGVDVDGHMGQMTLAAVKDHSDVASLIHAFSQKRREYYQALKQFPIYGKGWIRRANETERDAIRMSPSSPTPVVDNPISVDVGSAKAPPTDVSKTIISTESAGGATAGGGVITTTLSQVQMQLSQFSGLKIAVYISLAITLALGLYTIYAFLHKQNSDAAIGA